MAAKSLGDITGGEQDLRQDHKLVAATGSSPSDRGFARSRGARRACRDADEAVISAL